MFGKLKDFFSGKSALVTDAQGQATDRDLQIATGVLLLEMAGKDQDYAPEEVQTIFQVMKTEFSIDEPQVMELLEMADSIRAEKGKIDDFVDAINSGFNEKQRERVLSMIWRVIVADNKIDKFEQRFATQMSNRLKLSAEVAARGKAAAS